MVATAERGIVTPDQTTPLSPITEIKPYAERLEERRQEMLLQLPRYTLSDWYKDVAIYKNDIYPQLVLDTTDNGGIWGFTIVDPLGVLQTNHFSPLPNYYDVLADTREHYTKYDPNNNNDQKHRWTQYILYENAKFFMNNVFAPFAKGEEAEVEIEPDEDIDTPNEDVVLIEADIPQVGRPDLLFATGGTRFHVVEIGPKGKQLQAENYAKGLRRRYNLPDDRVTWSVALYGAVDTRGGDVVLITEDGYKKQHERRFQAA